MTDLGDTAPTRVICYADQDDPAASHGFYTEVLGLEVTMNDPVLGFTSPANRTAQVLVLPADPHRPQPKFGIDLGFPDAVDAAHDAAERRGLRVVYPITDEPWGVRRFFVEDPGGTVVNVLAHLDENSPAAGSTTRILPRLIVPDPDDASAFYRDTLGTEEVFRAPAIDDGRSGMIEHTLGENRFRVSPAVREWGWLSPLDVGGSAVLLEAEVPDPDACAERMVDRGADLVVSIEDRPYGQRSGRIRDPFGHLWILTGKPIGATLRGAPRPVHDHVGRTVGTPW